MEGLHERIRRFAVGPVYLSKSLTMCSSDFVFRKYKQDNAFRVSGVVQLAKTGPLVTKNFPLLRLFSSDMTSTVLICIFWPRAECRTFWLELADFGGIEKLFCAPDQSLNSKIMNQSNIDLNFLE